MKNDEPIRNPEYDKLPEGSKVIFMTLGEQIKVGPPPVDRDADFKKLIEDLRHYCVNKQAELELVTYKMFCYKSLLESAEVTTTEEGKRRKGLIDRL